MNDKTVIELARDCGINFHQAKWPELKRFAALVRADEREACAKLCDRMAQRTQDIRSAALESAAENIRARGTT